jgi:hypothetical protein
MSRLANQVDEQSDEDSDEESDDDDEEDSHRPATKAAPKPKRAVNGTRKGKSTNGNGPAPKKQRKQAIAPTNGETAAEPQGESFKTDSAFFSMSLLFLSYWS